MLNLKENQGNGNSEESVIVACTYSEFDDSSNTKGLLKNEFMPTLLKIDKDHPEKAEDAKHLDFMLDGVYWTDGTQ